MQITRAQARTRREYLESRPPPRRGLGHQYKGVGGSASVEGDHGGSNNLQRGSRRRLQKRQPLELFPDRFAYGKVICWDQRTNRRVVALEECHTEAITQVRFHPSKQAKLVSASVDKLMCVFHTVGNINDDKGMDSVMGVGTSIAKIGFYGMNHKHIWC